MRKRQRVTLNGIERAIAKGLPPKKFIEHGYGQLTAGTTGEQEMGIIATLGADRHYGNDGTSAGGDSGTRVHQSPLPFVSKFLFDKIMYPNATTTVQYGALPEDSYITIEKEKTNFYFTNSSSATMWVQLYRLTPRRTLMDLNVAGDDLYSRLKTATNYVRDAYISTVGANDVFHNAAGVMNVEIDRTTWGVQPYDNPKITQDWYIKSLGVRVMEPGENVEFAHKAGRYRYSLETSTLVYYSKEHTAVYIARIWGEPVKTDEGASISKCKLIWTWLHTTKWQIPILFQYGGGLTQTDENTITGTSPKQVIAVTPTSAAAGTGVTPTNV